MSHLQQTFSEISPRPNLKKKPAPFSLRLTREERNQLECAAAGMPLGAFIKSRLFEDELKPRRTRGHAPVKDHAALARALGLLGRLNQTASLSELVQASRSGAAPVSSETEEQLEATCAAVRAVRAELMKALGYKVEGDQ